MMTGDSVSTASSIARSCGIIGGERTLVIEGERLASMTDAQIAEQLPRIAVICRALPTDKSRLVRIAQGLELVVGMTGDGVNDAPALKCADIGFAMGSGTDVAKDAGDIIILDNNLASIVKAVLYGRNIFKSIRKFITLQLTMNFCAVGVTIIGPQVGLNRRVVAVQRFDKEGEPFEVYPNVRIVWASDSLAAGPEGCLSVPDRRGEVLRSEEIVIEYADITGIEHSLQQNRL
jgi:magnesium-transporting ATPase (P-type)